MPVDIHVVVMEMRNHDLYVNREYIDHVMLCA